MTTQEVLNLNKSVLETWNAHDTKKFLSFCDESVVWIDTGIPDPFRGKEEAGNFFNMWTKAFPDLKIKLVNAIANETSIACEIEFSGTNTGALVMPGQPEIAATNRTVSNKGSYFANVRNGKVIEVRSYPDRVGMMTQLGLMQEQHAHA